MRRIKDTNGYSIIEVVVAMSVFATIMTLGLGIFMATSRVTTQNEAMRVVQEDVRTALDQISRDIREGHIKGITADNPSTLEVKLNNGTVISYTISSDKRIQKIIGTESSYLTSDKSSIENLSFKKTDFSKNGIETNLITINAKGKRGDALRLSQSPLGC